MSQAVFPSSKPISFTQDAEKPLGQMRSRNVEHIVPSSHLDCSGRGGAIKIGLIIAAAILLGSILMWSIGASTGVVGLEIAGKVFFGLSIGTVGIALLGIIGVILLCKDNL